MIYLENKTFVFQLSFLGSPKHSWLYPEDRSEIPREKGWSEASRGDSQQEWMQIFLELWPAMHTDGQPTIGCSLEKPSFELLSLHM